MNSPYFFSSLSTPAGLTDDHLTYLDDLRQTGVTNMFGARPYLMDVFPTLAPQAAGAILAHWMKTYLERHP